MTTLDENVRSLFARPLMAWATTVRTDGSLHSTVVWADVDEQGLFFNTAVGRAKERNLLANPEVSLSVIDPENAFHFASVSGQASLQTGGADDVIDGLAKKYLGVDSYPYRRADEQRVTVRITPTRVIYSSGD